MTIFVSAVFFGFGAIIASFVGVLSCRLNTGQSFLAGRSRCDACNKPLHPSVLIPIVSYFTTGGRALCCGARVSPASTVTEILLGALFVLSYLSIGLTPALFFFLFSLSTLLALVLYDLVHQILPTKLLYVFVLSSLIAGFLLSPSTDAFYSAAVTAFLIAASLALIHFLSRGRAMGFADAPFSLGLAFLVGPTAFTGFVFSFWIGAVIGIAMLARRPVGSRIGVEVPFAPFLATGFLLAYFTQWNIFVFVAASR